MDLLGHYVYIYYMAKVVIDVVKSLHGCDRELIFNVISQLRSKEIPITSIWKPSPYNSYVYVNTSSAIWKVCVWRYVEAYRKYFYPIYDM